ncbi:MAG: hypothetical protein HFE51_02395 [Clostridia bacterium]|nr:hypothetical protein [Clostridia bacterium]
MDGLECCEIKCLRLKDENPNFRIDSDFFGKQVLGALTKVKSLNHYYLKPRNIVNGPFGSTIKTNSHLKKGYIPLIRSININSGFYINNNDLVYISKEDNNLIKHSQLNKDDIVLSRVGSIGYFARVDARVGTCNISSNNIGIKLDNFKESEKHYILTYLNTKFAYELTNRRISGNVQPKLTVEELCRIPIPSFSEIFYKAISTLVLNSEAARNQSHKCYSFAESSIISALEIVDLEASKQSISVKSLLKSFVVSGRLDAEYYQPKYENIESQIIGNNTVSSTCNVYDNNFIPENESVYQYIELANVDTTGGISTPGKLHGKDLPSRARRLVKEGQVIISSIEGSLQSCALITKEFDNALCSTGFYVIDSEKYNSETLLLLFKSEPIQTLLKKRCSGTILTAISKEELLKMPLPDVDEETQIKIAEKVQESFGLRNESKRLLELAVKTVEMAIKKDEEVAINWLESQR